MLALNLLLTGLWVLITGDPGAANALVGFVLGLLLLAWVWPDRDDRRYFYKLPAILAFAGFFLVDLVRSSLRIALDVVTPQDRRQPAIVCVPLDVTSDVEIALLSILITLTPGTVALGLSDDRRSMLVHAMFAPDDEQLRRQIKDGYERRVRELLS